MSRSHRLSDDEGTDPGSLAINRLEADARSLWSLIQFSTEQCGPASRFLSSPPPPKWDHHTLLAKTNLQFSSSVMLRRRFTDPLLLLSKSCLLFSSLNYNKGQVLYHCCLTLRRRTKYSCKPKLILYLQQFQ